MKRSALFCLCSLLLYSPVVAQDLFGPLQVSSTAFESIQHGLHAADLNNDGFADIIYSHGEYDEIGITTYRMRIRLGIGDGTFGAPFEYEGLEVFNSRIHYTAIDLNDDGFRDILIHPFSYLYMTAIMNNGDGTFPERDYSAWSWSTSGSIMDIGIGDIDSDGYPDMAAVNDERLVLLMNDGTGHFDETLLDTYHEDNFSVAVGLVDGDLHPDLCVSDISGYFRTFLNDGTGSFIGGPSTRGDSTLYSDVQLRDMDCDGISDLLCLLRPSYAQHRRFQKIQIMSGNGDGTFQSPVDIFQETEYCQVALGDINNDHYPDLVISCRDLDYIKSLVNGGDGTFTTSDSMTTVYPHSPDLADLDADTRPDLVVIGEYDLLYAPGLSTQTPFFHYVSPLGENIPPYTRPEWAAHSLVDAISLAIPGDTVCVAWGDYEEDVDISSGIYLKGGFHPNFVLRDPAAFPATIINSGSTVEINSVSEGPAGLDGFTLSGGIGTYAAIPTIGNYGGGIFVDQSNVVIKNNTIVEGGHTDPGFFSAGGAIACNGGTALISGNTIRDCDAQSGGGIYLYQTDAVLTGNSISGASPDPLFTGMKNGGGIYARSCDLTLSGNSVSSNTGFFEGGGIFAEQSSIDLKGDSIFLNESTSKGGGIFTYHSNVSMDHVVIDDNSTQSFGGGIFSQAGGLEISNSVISRNIAHSVAGGLFADSTWGDWHNNTFHWNGAQYAGGNIFTQGTLLRDIRNNMVTNGYPDGFFVQAVDGITFQFNNTYGNNGSDVVMIVPDTTNISAAPHYADMNVLDLHPSLHSSGIDAGDPALTDPDGSRSDIGAFGGPLAEFSAPGFIVGLTSVTADDTTISLSWDASPEEDIDFYAIYADTMSEYHPDELLYLGSVPAGTETFLHFPVEGCRFYKVCAINSSGYAGGYSSESTACADGITTDIGDTPLLVDMLGANYPNPFNGHTTISYSIRSACHLRLKIYDAAGRLVRTLIDTPTDAGEFRMAWDGRDDFARPVASGVFFLQMTTGDYSASRKIVYLR